MNEDEKEKYIGYIFSGIAHEIRNPLQGIIASAAAMACHIEDNPALYPFLDMIQRETSRINAIIDDMLELTHPVQFDNHPYPARVILDDALKSVEEVRSKNNSNIVFAAESNMPEIQGDRQKLTRSLAAVIENAIESRQGASVEIDLRSDLHSVYYTVRDDGPGITAEDLPHIFEPFYSTKRKRAGLGLCIAHRVIRAHEGQIEIQSETGKGTTVTLQLPRKI